MDLVDRERAVVEVARRRAARASRASCQAWRLREDDRGGRRRHARRRRRAGRPSAVGGPSRPGGSRTCSGCPSSTPGQKSSQTPLAPSERIWWTRPSQPLKSPTTLTERAFGAQTEKEVPATPSSSRACAPSTSRRAPRGGPPRSGAGRARRASAGTRRDRRDARRRRPGRSPRAGSASGSRPSRQDAREERRPGRSAASSTGSPRAGQRPQRRRRPAGRRGRRARRPRGWAPSTLVGVGMVERDDRSSSRATRRAVRRALTATTTSTCACCSPGSSLT